MRPEIKNTGVCGSIGVTSESKQDHQSQMGSTHPIPWNQAVMLHGSVLLPQVPELQTGVGWLENLSRALPLPSFSHPAPDLPYDSQVQGEINGMKYYRVPLHQDGG